MTSPTLTLDDPKNRAQAHRWIDTAPDETTVTFSRGEKRTTDQNKFLWPLLAIIAQAVPWHGYQLTKEDWKLIFLEELEQQLSDDEKMGLRVMPNLRGNGFVQIGGRSSRLKKDQFSMLLESILAFCAENGIDVTDPRTDKPETQQAA
jgi:hypothetical protein